MAEFDKGIGVLDVFLQDSRIGRVILAGAAEADEGDGSAGEEGGGFGGAPSTGNLLSEQMLADDAFTGLYQQKTAELSEALYDSGAAEEIISDWVDVLISGASNLVDTETIVAEADAVRTIIDGLS